MSVLKDDMRRIVHLGFKEEFFTVKSGGLKLLKNVNGRCVFHNGEQCTIYSNRPEGCKNYPIIFDENLNHPVKDKLCPFRSEFRLSATAKKNSSKLYLKLIGEEIS